MVYVAGGRAARPPLRGHPAAAAQRIREICATYGFEIDPDVAIAVDVTLSGDLPDTSETAAALGKGTAIKIRDRSAICSRAVVEDLENLATHKGIPAQRDVLSAGGTDVGGSVTIVDKDITLYPITEKGNWVYYESRDGSYVAPFFVAPGAVTERPADPTRTGFDFDDWYTDNETFANKFEFGHGLEEDITLYAKWTGEAGVKYLIIHWKETLDEVEEGQEPIYAFADSEEGT